MPKPNYFTLDNYADIFPATTRIDYTQSVPIWQIDLRQEIDPQDICDKIKDYKNKWPIGKKLPGYPVNAWTTDLLVIRRTNSFNPLVESIISNCRKINQTPHTLLQVGESWLTIYKSLDNVTQHNHGGCTLVAVYYAEADNAAPIVFDKHKIVPEAGTMLVFPGFLDHKVLATGASNGKRSIFGCNLYMMPDFNDPMLQSTYYDE